MFYTIKRAAARRWLAAFLLPLIGLSQAAAQPPYLDKLELLQRLTEAQYDSIDKRLSALQTAFEQGQTSDLPVEHAFNAFENAEPALLKHLDAWRAHRPDSYAALLARGIHHAKLGWLARGGALAINTSEQQMGEMRRYFSIAQNDFNAALKINPTLTLAYAHLIRISMTINSPADTEALFRRAEAIRPDSFILRRQYLWSLQPKWGGSLQAMRAFLKETEPHMTKNPALKELMGYPYLVLADALEDHDRNESENLLNKSLTFGDHWRFYYERGINRYYQKQYNEALSDLSRALALNPQDPDTLGWRSKTHERLDNKSAAHADINLALRLNAMDDRWLRMRGRMAYEEKRYADALPDFEDALKFGGHAAYNWWNSGKTYLYGFKDYIHAAERLKRASELEPENAQYQYSYALALYHLRDCAIKTTLEKYISLCDNGARCGDKEQAWARNVIPQFQKLC